MPDGTQKGSALVLPTAFSAATQINTLLNPSVLIIGAGIGGITLALDLDEKGLTNWLVSPPRPSRAPTDHACGACGDWGVPVIDNRIIVLTRPPSSLTARTMSVGRGM